MTLESTILELLTAALLRPFVLVAAGVLVVRVFRAEHPASQHAIWTVVLAAMFVLPFAVILAPHVEFPVLPESALFSLEQAQPLHEERTPVNHAQENPTGSATAGIAGTIADIPLAAVEPTSANSAAQKNSQGLRWGTVAIWFYLLGLGGMIANRVVGWVLLWRVRSRSIAHGYPWLRESPDVVVPTAIGIVRPAVLLPLGWRSWPAYARRAALVHEFAHIRRRDAWVQSLSRLARCLFWFHPLVWWVSRKISELAEMSCDAVVLQRGVDPFRYSRVLVDFSDVVRKRGYRTAVPGLAIAGRSWLSRRIDHVLAMASTRPRRLARPLVALGLVGVPVLTAAATLQLTERGVVRVLPPAIEQRAAAAVSSAFGSIIQVATNFNSVPLVSQEVPTDGLFSSQTPASARNFIDTYCVDCHNNRAWIGGVSLENSDLSNLRTNAEVWEKVIRKLRSGVHVDSYSSPNDNPKVPPAAETQAVVTWLEAGLDQAPPVFQGSPVSHRLNRTEYANEVRDLLGLELDMELVLPRDDTAYSFDNIASVLEDQLSRSPADTWTSAAASVTRLAMTSPVARNRILTCVPVSNDEMERCGSEILTRLAVRAYRGKETASDISDLMAIYRKAAGPYWGFESAIGAAMRGLLANRKFLYRDETVPGGIPAGESYAVDDIDLANRLSFFLWSTGPDSRLLDLARQGRLKDPAVLEAEARRMLEDPRSEALAIHFAGQWLGFRRMQSIGPLPLFKEFDDTLGAAMKREAELFFDSIVREDRNVLDLLNGEETFVNARLARHYGIPNVTGDQFRRVVLGPEFDNRRGLLGKAAILTVTSRPARTSIVGRGKWVLTSLIGVPPPDPPPNVPPMPTKVAGRSTDPTLREIMEQHTSDPRCQGCHALTDPIGIAMENFDAIGKWRTEDEGKPIDPVVDFLDGTRLSGPADLRRVLNERSELFMRTLTHKLLTYALGRPATYQDMPIVRSITAQARANNDRFSSFVVGIVTNPLFRMNVKR